MKTYPFYLGGKAVQSKTKLDVKEKYSGDVFAQVSLASEKDIDQAISLAEKSRSQMQALSSYERQQVLEYCIEQFVARQDELAETLCLEAGKPLKDSVGEVGRLIDTFKIAAEEAVRMNGEVLSLDRNENTQNYSGMVKKFPVGVCSFISPFNFPLNLVAHKVAPAIAAGCPFILKPASLTPLGALIIGEILSASGLPEGAFSILPCSRDSADMFVEDERIKLLSFTGSPAVGWDMKKRAGKKKVVLELGGNAACVVDQDADIKDAVSRIIIGAFYQSGQSCIGVQRIFVHDSIYTEFEALLISETAKLKSGDPKDKETFVGPIISSKEADRIESWVNAAVDQGAKVLIGGERFGNLIEPTLLKAVSHDVDLYNEEVFGPVAFLEKFSDFDEVLKEVNNSRFGLQAGIFTRDLYKAHKAWDVLEVGGVVIGDIPSWRVDSMPYGGVKDSGFGREGIRYAIEDMSEDRLMVIRTTN
ncbi:MAG: aldehyde dehydrogenase family protein [Lentisphaeraceae bacterium]|nr:aldehyde dehydrogenase family protein [Lentisphaeraceae bacterium]